MKSFYISLLAVVFMVIGTMDASCGKTVKIKLTGTIYESMQVKIGDTGQTAVISSLPYDLEILKSDLPIKLKFESGSYLYYDIDVPKKPFDTTGHVYLVKINETAMALRSQTIPAATLQPQGETMLANEVKGIDLQHGVNAAPITGIKNDKTFALIISNEEYEMASRVEHATNDGLAFKEYCLKTLGIPASNLRYASNLSFGKMKKSVSDMLDLAEMLNGEGNLIVYYAGHGIPDNKTKDAYLMPVDADGTDTDVCISLKDLYDKIDSKNLNRCVVFLDACFSGAQRGGDMIVAARGVKLKPKEVIPAGKTIVFSATSDDEAAYAHNSEQHGLFTYFLLSKLQESKGKISLGELADYLKEKVAFESLRINNNRQSPKVSVATGLENSWRSIKLTK